MKAETRKKQPTTQYLSKIVSEFTRFQVEINIKNDN